MDHSSSSEPSSDSGSPPGCRFALGVGCLWFARNLEQEDSAPDYFDQLRSSLLSIENLTDLELEGEDADFGTTIVVNNRFAKGTFGFPHVYGSTLRFKLFIPYRVQKEIGAECVQESFEILICHHYSFPVMYVATECIEGYVDATTPIVLIREYLKKKLTASPLQSGVIGPSPFHAQFFCVRGDSDLELSDITSRPGYKHYKFSSDASPAQSVAMFSDMYGETLSLFYDLYNDRSAGLDREIDVINSAHELLAPSPRLLKKLVAPWTHRRLIDTINRNTLEEEISRTGMLAQLEEAREGDVDQSFSRLQSHFTEIARFASRRPFESTRQIASSFESRRQSNLENASVLVGGLIGGLVGSLLTYLLATPASPATSRRHDQAAQAVAAQPNTTPADTPATPQPPPR